MCGMIGCMKRNYDLFKNKAVRLRHQGLSYGEIRKKIPVAKSTLSVWLKGIRLNAEHRSRLYTKQIQLLALGSQSQRQRRARQVDIIISQAEKEIESPLPFAAYRLLGAALYWAEGSKSKRFELTNSDPHLILFIVRWIERVFKIPAPSLTARLNIYPQQNELAVKKFWARLTGIPLQNFGKSYIKPLSKNYKKNNLYYGTIRIEIPKSTDICYRIFGWVKAVLKDISPRVDHEQRFWKGLRATPRPVNLSK